MSQKAKAHVAKNVTDSVKSTNKSTNKSTTQLLKKLLKSYEGITCEMEILSPEEIKNILMNCNINNRPARVGAIKRYATDILNGNWMATGETIVFDNKGYLKDGQTRLMAAMQANATLPFLVVRGVPEEAFIVMDSGATRTPGDIFTIAGIEKPGKCANCMSSAISLLKGKKAVFGSKGDTNLTASGNNGNKSALLLEHYRQHAQAVQEAIEFASNVKKTHSKQYFEVGLTEGNISGVIVYLTEYLGYETDKVYNFFKNVYLMDEGNEGHSRLFTSLRNTLSVNYYDKVRRILPAFVQSYIAKTFYLYLEGKLNQTIKLTKEEEISGVPYIPNEDRQTKVA